MAGASEFEHKTSTLLEHVQPALADVWTRIQPAVGLLSEGIHLLKSLDENGRMLIVAIDAKGKLLSVGRIKEVVPETMWFPAEVEEENKITTSTDPSLFASGSFRRRLHIQPLGAGIHQAPWRPRFAIGGQALIVVNALGLIAGIVEVPQDRDPNDPAVLSLCAELGVGSTDDMIPPREL